MMLRGLLYRYAKYMTVEQYMEEYNIGYTIHVINTDSVETLENEFNNMENVIRNEIL